jgi:hypothetical protein
MLAPSVLLTVAVVAEAANVNVHTSFWYCPFKATGVVNEIYCVKKAPAVVVPKLAEPITGIAVIGVETGVTVDAVSDAPGTGKAMVPQTGADSEAIAAVWIP